MLCEKVAADRGFETAAAELTALADELPACRNVHLDATEHEGRLVDYVDVIPEDIGTANRLCHQVLGRSLDELAPQTRRLLIQLDEMISGHYGRFKEYRNNGYLPGLASRAGLVVSEVNETPIDGILIWELRREIHA